MQNKSFAPSTRAYLRVWPWLMAGFFVIFGLLGSLGYWSHQARLEGAIISQGVVAVQSKIRTVQHLDGGIVRQIHVRNSQRVRAGDLLISLDDAELKSSLEIVRIHLRELLTRKARLMAERDGRRQIDFSLMPAELADGPELERIEAGQHRLFEARRKDRAGQASLLDEQIAQLEAQIKGFERQYRAKTRQISLTRRELGILQRLLRKKQVTLTRVLSLQKEQARLEGEAARHISDIAHARSAIKELRMKILQIGKSFRAEVVGELRDTETKLSELREKAHNLAGRLARVQIRAPVNGYVHNLVVHTIGGVIKPATTIMQIIPEKDNLIIEARINPSDIDIVRVGQSCKVHFNAFKTNEIPVLNAKLMSVSGAAMKDPATGASYFTVSLAIASDELNKLPVRSGAILPGTPAEVYLQTGTRTALSYLMRPLMQQLERAFREQ